MVYSSLLKTAALLASTLLVSLGAADGNQETVTLKHPSGSSVEISVFGAQILSFRSSLDPKADVLFMSSESGPDGVTRGGISIVFPNVAAGVSSSPALGFARSSQWIVSSVAPTTDKKGSSYAAFRLESSTATLKMWPYKFELVYEVNLWATSLESKFHVISQHSSEMKFNALLQNHLYVPTFDDKGVVVSGLKGLHYSDLFTGKKQTESRASLSISSKIDNVYENVKNNVTVSVKGEKFTQNVVFETAATFGNGADRYPTARDHVVFNPWSEGSKAAGFGDKGYTHVVAIGSGKVSAQQSLSASLRYILQQTISVAKQ